jgi:hypothetical protein
MDLQYVEQQIRRIDREIGGRQGETADAYAEIAFLQGELRRLVDLKEALVASAPVPDMAFSWRRYYPSSRKLVRQETDALNLSGRQGNPALLPRVGRLKSLPIEFQQARAKFVLGQLVERGWVGLLYTMAGTYRHSSDRLSGEQMMRAIAD